MNQKQLDFFKEENFVKSTVVVSEDKKYTLTIMAYDTSPGCWDYTMGVVRKTGSDEILFDIKRNYPSFWHLFINHPNGNDYFLAGRNYHGGYSVVDLTNGIEYCYDPENDPHEKYTAFFCWIQPKFIEENKTLEVEGCYWGAPFEIVTFDFSDPTKLPLKELSRRDEGYDELFGEYEVE